MQQCNATSWCNIVTQHRKVTKIKKIKLRKLKNSVPGEGERTLWWARRCIKKCVLYIYIKLVSPAGSSQPSSPAAQPSAEPPHTHQTTPRPRFLQHVSSSCWTVCLWSASTAIREINGYEGICYATWYVLFHHIACWVYKKNECCLLFPWLIQKKIQMKSLIYYSFIALLINFTLVMKERCRCRWREETRKDC